MNEQDKILNEKIEKREKFDIILAYILLVVLIGGIVFVLYLKFVSDKQETAPEEYTANYINLNDISSSLNSSILANRYMNEGVNFNSTVSKDVLIVNYVKENVNLSFNIPVVNNELMINVNKDYNAISTEIYKEIANIICVYYGNDETSCRNTLNNLDADVYGIRFSTNGNNKVVYITITDSIKVNDIKEYNTITKVGINETDYVLNISGFSIYNINIVTSSNGIKFKGEIKRVTDSTSDVSVVVKIYDSGNKLLEENKYEYNKNNVLGSSSTFEIEFLLNNKLNLNNIDNYSIEIAK